MGSGTDVRLRTPPGFGLRDGEGQQSARSCRSLPKIRTSSMFGLRTLTLRSFTVRSRRRVCENEKNFDAQGQRNIPDRITAFSRNAHSTLRKDSSQLRVHAPPNSVRRRFYTLWAEQRPQTGFAPAACLLSCQRRPAANPLRPSRPPSATTAVFQ